MKEIHKWFNSQVSLAFCSLLKYEFGIIAGEIQSISTLWRLL